MVARQHYAFGLQDGNPATYLETLAALVDHHQVEFALVQVSLEDFVSCSHIRAADYLGIGENLLDDLLLEVLYLCPDGLDLPVNLLSLSLNLGPLELLLRRIELLFLTLPQTLTLCNHKVQAAF